MISPNRIKPPNRTWFLKCFDDSPIEQLLIFNKMISLCIPTVEINQIGQNIQVILESKAAISIEIDVIA